MILVIELNPADADVGGKILKQMGANAAPGGTFTVRIPVDVNLPDDYIHLYPYVEALLDQGVKPLRLRLMRSGNRPTSVTVSGSAEDRAAAMRSLASHIRRAALEADENTLSAEEVKMALEVAKSLEQRA